jgi:hypothetical protein
MKRAKQAKRASAKATLRSRHRQNWTRRGLRFCEQNGFLELDQRTAEAGQCARQAARATETGIRSSYEKLARSWRELAQHAEELMTKGGR